MFRITRFIPITMLAILPVFAYGQKSLPRVLVLGDSVASQATREMPKEIKSKVEVVYGAWQPGEVADTTTALRVLERLLGHIDRNGKQVPAEKRKKWDVIHFNFGLGDLVHRVPGLKSVRVMPIHAGGVCNTNPKQYEANLRELVKRLKATGAKLVWASTTPIRHSASNVFEMGSEVKYNAIAAKVMASEKIQINDMYTHVKGLIDMKKPAGHGADPFHFDRKPIHAPIVSSIANVLDIALPTSVKKK